MRVRTLALSLMSLVAGCAWSSTNARSELAMKPGARLLVHADGERPTIRIVIRGDGALQYTWTRTDGVQEGGVLRHGSLGNRTDGGCELVGVVIDGEIEAIVEVRYGRGVRIEAYPAEETAAAASDAKH